MTNTKRGNLRSMNRTLPVHGPKAPFITQFAAGSLVLFAALTTCGADA